MCASNSVVAKGAVYKSGLIPSTTNIVERDGASALTKGCTRLCCGIYMQVNNNNLRKYDNHHKANTLFTSQYNACFGVKKFFFVREWLSGFLANTTIQIYGCCVVAYVLYTYVQRNI